VWVQVWEAVSGTEGRAMACWCGAAMSMAAAKPGAPKGHTCLNARPCATIPSLTSAPPPLLRCAACRSFLPSSSVCGGPCCMLKGEGYSPMPSKGAVSGA